MDNLIYEEKNENQLINNKDNLINEDLIVAPIQKNKNNQFDYELPQGLKNYLIDIKGKENYAKNLLKDNFARQNAQYASSDTYKTDTETLKKIRAGEDIKITYEDQMKMEHRVSSKNYSDMVDDSKTFIKIVSFGIGGDSKSMKEIKKRINILQDFLAGSMEKFKKDDGTYDADKFGSIINDLFEGAIGACRNYLDTHRKSPLTIWGKRRMNEVREILNQLDLDYNKYKDATDVLASNAFKDDEELKSPEDLIEKEEFVEVEEAVHQREGNSTEVYLVKVREKKNVDGKVEEEVNEYYMKENLPLINKDIDGFLDRRKNELEASLGYKKDAQGDGNILNLEAKESKEELRMQKAHADETDYKNGIDFLDILKKSIKDTNNMTTKATLRNDYAHLFKHDFDKLFRELKEYNGAVEYFEVYQAKSMEELKEEAKTDPKAKVVYEILSKAGKQAAGEKIEKPKAKTPAEWVIEKLNIKDKKLKDFFNKIQKEQPVNLRMREQDDNDEKKKYVQVSRIEALFRITMGKEVELYGQIMEKDKIEDNEMSQYNTMATSHLGDKYGFKNEVVSTKIKKTRFKRWDGKVSQRTVTLQDVAKGKEWLDVIKDAKNGFKKVKLSMGAVKQLMRLQTFDTLTQQKDRHGRNFKCETDDGFDEIVVNKTKAYDHDQSFTTGNLATSFEEKRGKDGKLIEVKNNRFLPSMQRVVKKNSPMYNYILNKYFHTNAMDINWMKKEKEPTIKDVKTKRNNIKEAEINLNAIKKDLILTSFYGHKKTVTEVGNKKHTFADVSCSIELTTEKTDPDDKTTVEVAPHSVILKRGNERLKRSNKYSDAGKVLNGEENENGNIPVYSKCEQRWKDNEWETEYNPEGKKIIKEITDIMKTLSEFFVRKDINRDTGKLQRMYGPGSGIDAPYNVQLYFKKGEELNKSENLEKAARAIKKLKILNTKYDFSDVMIKHNGMVEAAVSEGYNFDPNKNFFTSYGTYCFTGILQAWIDMTLKMFADSFANNETVQNVMNEMEGDIPNDVQALLNENGDLVIPNMLHMDFDAYKSIQDIVAGFGQNGTLATELKKKHLSDAAIESIKTRAQEMLRRIDTEIKPSAEIFLKHMYPDPNDPRRNFFLKTDEDYNRFDSLYDFAIDPGDTYLVQDNKHFLACNEEYAQFLTEGEKQQILNMRNDTIKDTKRWNMPEGEKRLETVISDKIVK